MSANNPTAALVGPLMLVLRPIITIIENVVSPVWQAVKGVIGLVLWLLERPLHLALKLTPLGALLRRLTHDDNVLHWLETESRKLVKPEGDGLLVHGKRDAYAELIAPKAKFPLLWMSIPTHLKKSIVIDGKTLNDMAPAPALAANALTGEFVERAYRAAVLAGTRATYLSLLAGIVFAFYVSFGGFSLLPSGLASSPTAKPAFGQAVEPGMPGQARQRRAAPSADEFNVAQTYKDVWSREDAEEVASKLRAAAAAQGAPAALAAKVQGAVSGTVQFIILLVAAAGVAVAAGRYVWLGRFRHLVFTAVDKAAAPLRKPWREGQQRNRDRQEERELMLDAYLDQVLMATQVDHSPRIYLGDALGVAEFRGHLNAPKQFQEVYMTVVDLMQHVEILGGSGEGKSRDVFVNVLRQLLKLRAEGYPISLYIVDDKGEMAALVRKLCKELSIPDDDLLVIGTDKGDRRVDLLDGISPVVMAEIMSIVAAQSGGTADDFWPDMANDLTLQTAIVLEAAERTRAGEAWVRQNGMRMYSFVNILRTALSNDAMEESIKMVLDALQSDEEYVRLADLDATALYAATEYLIDTWLNMVDATKDGVKINARKALRGMVLREELSKGFGDGAGENLIPITALASNKIKVVNISQTELGKAGRTVLIFLRTMRFKMGRDHQKMNPGFSDERLAWWMNGGSTTEPGREKYALEIFKADEYQTQATAASANESGLADSGVWNVLRSAAIGGMLYSQGIGAYELAIGEKATYNMRSQWRSKFILRTEDTKTIREGQELAGKVMRYHNINAEHFESMAAVRRQLGVDVDNLPKVKWNQSYDNIPLWLNPGQTKDFYLREWDEAYELDERFTPDASTAESASQVMASAQAAAWRQEDRNKDAFSQGMYDGDVVKPQDFKSMGRARAFGAWQCCGGSMTDFVWMNAEANKARRDQLLAKAIKANDETLLQSDALV